MSVTSLIGLGFAFGSNCLLPRRMTCFTGTSSLSNSCNIAAIWQLSSSNLCSELSAVDSVTPCIITLVLLFWISSSSTLSSRNWLRSAPSTHSCTSSGMIVFLVAFVHSFSIFSSNSWTVFFSTVSPRRCSNVSTFFTSWFNVALIWPSPVADLLSTSFSHLWQNQYKQEQLDINSYCSSVKPMQSEHFHSTSHSSHCSALVASVICSAHSIQ